MPHKLFSPYKLKSLPLKNRMVMAPMTRCRAGDGDIPTPLMAKYYAQRTTAGLIVTEGTPVSSKGRGYLWTPGIYTTEQISGWSRVAKAVHDSDGRIFVQIWHVGRISHQNLQPNGGSPEGPTDQQPEDAVCFTNDKDGNPGNVPISRPQALDDNGIARIQEEFVQAARNAREAGMDGVEIHGANGYLFDEFLNSVVNTRSDAYGGSVENRCRLLLETVDAVADAIGAERTGVRISPNGRFNAMPEDPEMEATFIHLAEQLDRRGIAYLHINDQATFGMPAIPDGLIQKSAMPSMAPSSFVEDMMQPAPRPLSTQALPTWLPSACPISPTLISQPGSKTAGNSTKRTRILSTVEEKLATPTIPSISPEIRDHSNGTTMSSTLPAHYMITEQRDSDLEHEDEVEQFIIYRSVKNGPFERYATSSVTSYTDRNLPNDFDRLEYYVTAENACGESEPSDTVVVRPRGPSR